MVVFSGAGILLILASIGIEAFAAKDMVKHEGIISIERDSGVESGGLFYLKRKRLLCICYNQFKRNQSPKRASNN